MVLLERQLLPVIQQSYFTEQQLHVLEGGTSMSNDTYL